MDTELVRGERERSGLLSIPNFVPALLRSFPESWVTRAISLPINPLLVIPTVHDRELAFPIATSLPVAYPRRASEKRGVGRPGRERIKGGFGIIRTKGRVKTEEEEVGEGVIPQSRLTNGSHMFATEACRRFISS